MQKKNKKVICLLLCSIFLLGCRSINVNKTLQHSSKTEGPVALGVLGLQKRTMLKDQFKVTGLPKMEQRIRVQIQPVKFNLQAFKKYSAIAPQNPHKIKYVDSLKNKPSYISINILDKLLLKENLIDKANKNVAKYIMSIPKTQIVTELSMVVPKMTLKTLVQAEALFLVSKDYKEYQLQLVTEGKVTDIFNFNDGTILGYGLSDFCWKINDRQQYELNDIVSEGNRCAKNSAKKLKKIKEKSISSYTKI